MGRWGNGPAGGLWPSGPRRTGPAGGAHVGRGRPGMRGQGRGPARDGAGRGKAEAGWGTAACIIAGG